MAKTGDYAFQNPQGCTPGDALTGEDLETIQKLKDTSVEQNKIFTEAGIVVPTSFVTAPIPGEFCSIDEVIVNGINQTENEHYTVDATDPANVIINFVDANGDPLEHGDPDEPCNIIVTFTCKVPLC